MSTLTVAQSIERMYVLADKRLTNEFGNGLHLLGTRIQRALYAEEMLRILAEQDEEVADSKVRKLLIESYLNIMD